MSIVYDKAEALIRAIPLIYRRLRPGAEIFYRVQRAQRKVRERISEKRTKREIERFRRYCMDLSNFISEPVFVKVGANDGVTDDPCSDILLSNIQWRGLLIEPVPYCFDRLKANFSDPQRFSLEQVAVGLLPREASFYYVDHKRLGGQQKIPYWSDQIGSFSKNHITGLGIPESLITECAVQVCTLSSLIKRNGLKDVHLLHIDTEGHDYEVLRTLDFTTQAPALVFVEHVHVPKDQKLEMVKLMRRHGYSVSDCGRDYFFINQETLNRLQHKSRRVK